jgi:CheY-like chemotaxis protein
MPTHDHRILVVEDDDDVRGALVAVLESHGYRVAEACDGRDALAQLREGTGFCLILLDLFMPVMNGWDFRVEQLKDPRLAQVPVLVITADALAVQQQAQRAGVVGAMTKPIDFDRLMEVIERHC